jgi:pimeloyl-ACP methyl ester carboxylesterase
VIDVRKLAAPRRWRVTNPSPRGGDIEIAGWDFGGDGPVALLHHANGLCAATWALVARELCRSFRVIAVDARGHGDSAHLTVPEDYDWNFFVSDLASVAAQVLEETGERAIALGLGSSFGGIITAAAEAQHPGLFQRLLMLDPPIHPTPELAEALGYPIPSEGRPGGQGLVEQTLRRRAVWASRDEARAAWQDKPLFAAWDPDAFELYLAEGLAGQADGSVVLKCPPEVEAHIFRTTGSLGPLDYAPKVQAPVRVTRAVRGFLPEDFVRRVVQLFPRGEFAELDGGHLLPLEVPEKVVDHVREWMAD